MGGKPLCARPGLLGGLDVSAGGIAVAIIAAVLAVGEGVTNDFQAVESNWP
jgi:hypothetical protein